MNYVNTRSMQVITPAALKMIGIDPDDSGQLAALGYEPVLYAYPVYDKAFYVPKAKSTLTKVDGGYVQEFTIEMRSDIDNVKQSLKDRATAKRWEVETGGINIDGFVIQSGVDDQNRIDSAINGMEAAGMEETDFKGANGWTIISLDQLKQVRVLLARHVEACFKREHQLHIAIDACESVEALAELDLNAGWPTIGAE